MEVEVVGAIQLPDVERMRGFGGRPPGSGIDGIAADKAIPHNPSYSVGGVAMHHDKRMLDAAVKMDPYCVLQSGKESVKTKRAHGMQLSALTLSMLKAPALCVSERSQAPLVTGHRWWKKSQLGPDPEVAIAARRQRDSCPGKAPWGVHWQFVS